MVRRSLIIAVLSCFALAAVAAAQAPPPASEDLMIHNRVFQDMDVTQIAAMLHLPTPPPEGYTQEEFVQVRVDAAVEYFIAHGYLTGTQGIGIHLSSGEDGVYTLTIDGPGIHVVIVLPCGPFLPHLTDQIISATVVRSIYNGF
jgi:hypothetical protein